jgi:hypothetical protein
VQQQTGSITSGGSSYTVNASSTAIPVGSTGTIRVVGGQVLLDVNAAAGAYRSYQTGTWSDAATWERYNGSSWIQNPSDGAPTSSSGSITILNTHNVTVTADVTVDQVTVNSGGTLTVNDGITVTVADGTGTDVDVAGTIQFVGSGKVSGAGRFNLQTGATIGIGSADGIAASAASGNVQTTTRAFSSGAYYLYNGTAAQATGDGLPTPLTGTVTIGNGNGTGVTLSQSTVVNTPGVCTVSDGGKLTMGASINITGTGTFTLSSGGTLAIASANGITASEASGNIQTTTRNFNTAANYIYNGTDAQATGDGLPATVNYLTINNAATVTLGANVTVSSCLTNSAGIFDLGTFTADRASAGGTLNLANGATLKIGGTGTFPANYSTHTLGASSTVEYSGEAQSVSVETYGNLKLSGTLLKTVATGTAVGGNLNIGGCKASLNNGINVSVASLTLGGIGRIDGTWGSGGSSATHQSDTYFDSTASGIVTVSDDARTTPTVSQWPTSASGITYGQTLADSTLASDGAATVAGTFAFTAPSTKPAANVAYSASVTFTPTDGTSYKTPMDGSVGVAVDKLAVLLSGTRAFDSSATAAFGILSINNKVGSDVVTVESGSATLADSGVGDQAITDASGLTLGGAAAGNYTLTGASGTVTITAAAGVTITAVTTADYVSGVVTLHGHLSGVASATSCKVFWGTTDGGTTGPWDSSATTVSSVANNSDFSIEVRPAVNTIYLFRFCTADEAHWSADTQAFMVKPIAAGSSYKWCPISVPVKLTGANNLSSSPGLGSQIAYALTAGTQKDSDADNVWIDQTQYWLRSDGWRRLDDSADVTINPGEGFWVKRFNTAARNMVFVGQACAATDVNVNLGHGVWTMFGWPFASQTLVNGTGDNCGLVNAGATAEYSWDKADNITCADPSSPFEIYLRKNVGWCARGTAKPTAVRLEPGKAYHYRHNGTTDMNWTAQ